MNARAIGVFALVATTFSLAEGGAKAQWDITGSAPMRIPSLEELSRPIAPRASPPSSAPAEAGSLGPFLNDSTLRNGDIVVTPEGPMKFRGRDALSHRSDDFAPLELPSSPPRPVR